MTQQLNEIRKRYEAEMRERSSENAENEYVDYLREDIYTLLKHIEQLEVEKYAVQAEKAAFLMILSELLPSLTAEQAEKAKNISEFLTDSLREILKKHGLSE